MFGLDMSFVNWEIISKFVIKGFIFSVELTVVATIGGIIFGTLLALMRLSGKAFLTVPATIYVNGMRSVPLVPAGARIVLQPDSRRCQLPRRDFGHHHFCGF